MRRNFALEEAEVDAGFVLTCQSLPVSATAHRRLRRLRGVVPVIAPAYARWSLIIWLPVKGGLAMTGHHRGAQVAKHRIGRCPAHLVAIKPRHAGLNGGVSAKADRRHPAPGPARLSTTTTFREGRIMRRWKAPLTTAVAVAAVAAISGAPMPAGAQAQPGADGDRIRLGTEQPSRARLRARRHSVRRRRRHRRDSINKSPVHPGDTAHRPLYGRVYRQHLEDLAWRVQDHRGLRASLQPDRPADERRDRCCRCRVPQSGRLRPDSGELAFAWARGHFERDRAGARKWVRYTGGEFVGLPSGASCRQPRQSRLRARWRLVQLRHGRP